MKHQLRQPGVTLVELTVVVGVMAMLAFFAVPAVRSFQRSFESAGSAKAQINAALSAARAIAAKEQHYAGIRFQMAAGPDVLNAPQYMTFIIHDPDLTGLAYGFRAVQGVKPIKLPESVGMMDLKIRNVNGAQVDVSLPYDISSPNRLRDTTTFSIIFSPSGRLVLHGVRVHSASPADDVFNNNGMSLFYQDASGTGLKDDADGDGYEDADDPAVDTEGLQEEFSRNMFIIYERMAFKQAYERGAAWTGYLKGAATEDKKIHVSPYMGTLISKD